MTPERYQEIRECYCAALEVYADRRTAFLAKTCGDDEELRLEVESLLGYREQHGLIDQPAVEVAAQALAYDTTTDLCNYRKLGRLF